MKLRQAASWWNFLRGIQKFTFQKFTLSESDEHLMELIVTVHIRSRYVSVWERMDQNFWTILAVNTNPLGIKSIGTAPFEDKRSKEICVSKIM